MPPNRTPRIVSPTGESYQADTLAALSALLAHLSNLPPALRPRPSPVGPGAAVRTVAVEVCRKGCRCNAAHDGPASELRTQVFLSVELQ